QEQKPAHPCDGGGFRNFFKESYINEEGEKVSQIVGFSIQVLYRAIHERTAGWPKGANGMLFGHGQDHEPLWMTSPAETFAWIAGQLGECDGRNKLLWLAGPDKVPQGQFHAFATQNAEQFDAVEKFPHWPAMPRHYYMHPA